MPELHVLGDIHGHLSTLRRLLQAGPIVDDEDTWLARDDILVLLGDLVDRGPDSLGLIELLMRLQKDAGQKGGKMYAVLGNHEAQLLAAYRMRHTVRVTDSPNTFFGDWQRWGGVQTDLECLRPWHLSCLEQLPTMLIVGGDLLVHADAAFYPRYGRTVEEVNATVADVLTCDDPARWDPLLRDMAGKRAFEGAAGEQFLTGMLDRFGARRLIHGHSLICRVLDTPPELVSDAYVYAGGRCVNADHGVYLGGPGFVFTTTYTG